MSKRKDNNDDDEEYKPKQRRKNSYEKEEALPSKKEIDRMFDNKCNWMGLPVDWIDDMPKDKIKCLSKTEESYCTNEYKLVKYKMVKKTVSLQDILSLKTATIEDKVRLCEKFAVMNNQYHPDCYLAHQKTLYDEIQYIKNDKLIQREEIEKLKTNIVVDNNMAILEKKIINLPFDKPYLSIVYNKFKKLDNLSPGESDYYKLKDWIDYVVNLPYNKYYDIDPQKLGVKGILQNAKKILDEELYGMKEVKEELLMIINHKLLNPNASNVSLALVGPPGVGKTQIIKTLGKILNLPMEHLSMGGINEVSYLNGHSYTWEGSRPGKIVTSLIRMNCANGILFFDEIDKIGQTHHSQEVNNLLIHTTDFTQNMNFIDKYIADIPIDLSKMWFIFSLNDERKVEPVLHNRLKFIKVPGYKKEDKFNILKHYLLKQNYEHFKLTQDDFVFTDEIIRYIVDKSGTEQGIRDLKRNTDSIFRRLELLNTVDDEVQVSFSIGDIKKPHTLTKKHIDILINIKQEDNISLNMMYI